MTIICNLVELDDGTHKIRVTIGGEDQIFESQQIMAILTALLEKYDDEFIVSLTRWLREHIVGKDL